MRQLLTATLCVALGITCLKLSFDRRIAPGSVPNFYLFVIGVSLFVVIPIFHVIHRSDRKLLVSVIGSFLVSMLLVITVLAFMIL